MFDMFLFCVMKQSRPLRQSAAADLWMGHLAQAAIRAHF
jgi:hypothetical protein